VIQAATLQMPVLQSPAGDALQIAGVAGSIVLDGLTVAGGAVTIAADVPAVTLRYCSLDPETSRLATAPAAAGGRLVISKTVTGPITASANMQMLSLSDSIVQDAAGMTAIAAVNAVSMEYTTIVGSTAAGVLTVSNSILLGPFTAADVANSGLRYSRHDNNPPPVRRFRCTTAFPIFASLRFGHPGYVHVTPNSAAEIRTGAEDGGEMGAFYRAGMSWRQQNVESKIARYIPAGLRAVPVRVLPSSRVA
jgi:hypothetical protein